MVAPDLPGQDKQALQASHPHLLDHKLLETIWSNPEMLSDLPTVAQQGLGFDLTLSTFPFLFFFLLWGLGFCKMEVRVGQALRADGAKEAA